MDQFCILDNEDGGSCACSDKNAEYEKRLEKIKDTLVEADRLKTEEVERVQAGANADIIFNGTREYDAKTGDVVSAQSTKATKEEKRKALLSLWDTPSDDDEDVFDDVMESMSGKTGDALFKAADELCQDQMDMDACGKEVKLLKQMYSRQIVSDCKGFANSIEKKEAEAKNEMSIANAAVRAALKDSLESSNKYDRGQCMVEYKKCMQTADACGKDWENCVFTIAAENMQNNQAISTAQTKVKQTIKYDIADSTMEILESKRYICEHVLDQCVKVREYVWEDFLREAAPTIKLAENKIESKKRQSCLTDISNCIQKACKDDIVGKGKETMDSCLARPDMARSFCKVEIDPCERMEPQIWAYVKDKLAAMRVDACTQEVKDCFTDDTRCGEDFSKCIGMDYKYIHEICPIDKLVVCKQDNPDFKMSDLDSMLMGLYLNIDNKELENCQKLIDEKMVEICGSTSDCNALAVDDTLGTGSLNYQKAGNIHRVSGRINFGKIKIGTSTKDAGLIDIKDYVDFLSKAQVVPAEYVSVADSVLYELENIQGTINRAVTLMENDPKIQFCINGRDLSQIKGKTGKKSEKTKGRFPNLLNQTKVQIAMAALRKAQDNYNQKYNEYVAKAMSAADVDMANLMCNRLPAGGDTGVSKQELDASGVENANALVLEYGGISNSSLASGGTKVSQKIGGARISTASGNAAGGSDGGVASTVASAATSTFLRLGGSIAKTVVSFNPATMIADASLKAVVALASDKYESEFDGGTREQWSVFNRETRVCRLCSSTITQDCKNKGRRGFLGLWDSRGVECTSKDPVETCQDIQM
ncbi:MAG: hypothetical protein J6S57_00250 [Alphaproteobacteria bacterium]|nr:hypothetical protein [Alphaproteobacteria bacterium]